jgi:hypothetical protein
MKETLGYRATGRKIICADDTFDYCPVCLAPINEEDIELK